MYYFFIMNKIEMKDIQNRLREAIKQSGIPQKELAQKIGVSPQTVSKYMRHDVYPSLDTYEKLSLIIVLI